MDARRTRRSLPCSLALAGAVLALSGAAAEPTPEARLHAATSKAYRAAGQAAPALDPALSRAASALASRARKDGMAAATSGEAVAREVSLAGGWDPIPRVVAARSPAAGRALQAIEARTDLASLPATRVGVAYVPGDPEVALLLLADRRALLNPFPRQVSTGASFELSGHLVFPLYDGQVVVAGPRGVARPEPRNAGEERNAFSARVSFPEAGEYTVEVVAQSVKGPEVAALLRVQAGRAAAGEPSKAAAEPAESADLAKAEAQVLAAINARRKAAGLRSLARSATLDGVAADHSQEMAKLDYFAHVSPVGGDLTQRLGKAGFAFRNAAENLGEAATALDAHRGIEASPGHLANLLDPRLDLVGLGTARVKRGQIDNVLLTEVFAHAAP